MCESYSVNSLICIIFIGFSMFTRNRDKDRQAGIQTDRQRGRGQMGSIYKKTDRQRGRGEMGSIYKIHIFFFHNFIKLNN